MIELSHVSKRYPVHGGDRLILDDINLRIERGEKIGILGRNGSGKSTLIRLISGAERPTSGTITRTMSVSWPLGFFGGFQGSLTGLDNIRFICRIYNAPFEDKVAFVEEFSELGRYLREPLKSYSMGMRARFAFAVSMLIEFDCFLIDEVVAVGDDRFKERCRVELFERRRDRSMVIVSHDATFIRTHCSQAKVVHGSRMHSFRTMDESFAFYEATASEVHS
jgi:capsular polysaccharide transport system ATP-binding protein